METKIADKGEKQQETDAVINDIRNVVEGIAPIGKKEELQAKPKPFQDKYATAEQSRRDEQITKLLKAYVANYIGKTNSNRKYKKVIFGVSIGLVIAFSLMIFLLFGAAVAGAIIGQCDSKETVFSVNTEEISTEGEKITESVTEVESTSEFVEERNMNNEENVSISIEAVVSLITVCVSYLVLVFGVLTIITKYVFPEKEEEYITAIVKLIQRNDLANKRENMRTDGYELSEKEEKEDQD